VLVGLVQALFHIETLAETLYLVQSPQLAVVAVATMEHILHNQVVLEVVETTVLRLVVLGLLDKVLLVVLIRQHLVLMAVAVAVVLAQSVL
jgi:hypothetical protein